MRKHASDGSPEHAGGSAVVDKGAAGVSKQTLAHEFAELNLVAEERAGDIDSLSSNDDDALTWVKGKVPARRVLAT